MIRAYKIRSLILWLGKAALVCLPLVMIVLLSALYKPQILIDVLQTQFVRTQIFKDSVKWNLLDVQIHSISFWQKELKVDFHELNIKIPELSIKLPSGSMQISFLWHPWDFQLLTLGPFNIPEGAIQVGESTQKSESGNNEKFSIPSLSFLQDAHFKPSSINLQSVKILGKTISEFRAGLKLKPVQDSNKFLFQLDIQDFNRLTPRTAKFTTTFFNGFKPDTGDSIAQFSGEIQENRQHIQLKASIVATESSEKKIRFQASLNDPNHSVDLKGSGFFDQNFLNSRFAFHFRGSRGNMPKISVDQCQIKARWQDSLLDALGALIDCNALIDYKIRFQEPFRGFYPVNLKPKIAAQIHFRNLDSRPNLSYKVKILLQEHLENTLAIHGETTLAGKIQQVKNNLQHDFEFDFNLQAEIANFQSAAAKLAKTQFAIPAPINSLQGPSKCQAKGKLQSKNLHEKIPFSCNIDLSSEGQKLLSQFKGSLSLPRDKDKSGPKIHVTVYLDKLHTILPDIDAFQEPPNIGSDGRIIVDRSREKAIAPKKSTPGIKYSFKIHSRAQDSISIQTNLVKAPIPLSIELSGSDDQPIKGQIAIASFPLELMRRKAKIKHFRIRLPANKRSTQIDGLMEFSNRNYEIQLKIFGSLEQPGYRFLSKPPLSENEMISILIFGHTADGINSDNAHSIKETQAAIADGAVNLLSMYYLASTPIQSIGYNPNSGVFSAKILLPSQSSITVGSNTLGQRELAYRKYIGKGWNFETTAVTNETTASKKGMALLKWQRRY